MYCGCTFLTCNKKLHVPVGEVICRNQEPFLLAFDTSGIISTLRMVTPDFSETWVHIYQDTQCHMPFVAMRISDFILIILLAGNTYFLSFPLDFRDWIMCRCM
jgi:hypothetical protein